MRILTIDLEEWFHLLDNDNVSNYSEWDLKEERIYENVDRILSLLEETETKATFFVIGWLARKYPNLIQKISEKYELGSHTFNHNLVWKLNRNEFREEVSSSVKLLEDLSGKPVKYFRAPGFSIRKSEAWAFEVLVDHNIEIDSSIFPSHHSHGGFPNFSENKPSVITYNGIIIKEFPISFKRIFNYNLIFSGGGYFRLFPYWLIKKWSNELDDYLISYIHPRDLDFYQPRIKKLGLVKTFKSYYGIKGADRKLFSLLTDFKFVDIHDADKMIDWTKVSVIDLNRF